MISPHLTLLSALVAAFASGGCLAAEPQPGVAEALPAMQAFGPSAEPSHLGRLPASAQDEASINQAAIRRRFCLVSHYTENMRDFAAISALSHRRYAERHGYGFRTYIGRISGNRFLDPSRGNVDDLWGGGLFWQKVAAIELALTAGVGDDGAAYEPCDWVFWLDSDTLITAPHRPLDEVLAPFVSHATEPDQQTEVVVSQETDHPVSAGAFFVRNSERGRSFVAAMAALYPLFKDNSLPEQTAMATLAYLAEPWPSNQASVGIQTSLHPNFAVAPQRTFNSFQGVGRTFGPEVQWQPGDFVAHFAGTPHAERSRAMLRLFLQVSSAAVLSGETF